MKALCALCALCVVLSFAVLVFVEPISPACAGALERISPARQALVPYRRTLEMARAYEYQANGEAAVCIGEGRWEIDPPLRYLKSQWQPVWSKNSCGLTMVVFDSIDSCGRKRLIFVRISATWSPVA